MTKTIEKPKIIVKICGIAISALVLAFIIYFLVFLFAPPEKSTVTQILNKIYGANISEEWEVIYRNTENAGGFHRDGTAYYVFYTGERNEDFLSDFAFEKDEAFEKTFRGEMKDIIFPDARFIPLFDNHYEWRKILREKNGEDDDTDLCYAKRLYMIFDPLLNYLYVIDVRL